MKLAALLVNSLLVLSLPVAFQAPRMHLVSAPSKGQLAKTQGTDRASMDKFVGCAEIALGIGLIFFSTGMITLRACSGSKTSLKSTLQATDAVVTNITKVQLTSQELTTSASNFRMVDQSGIMAPMAVPGESYWDPLGLAADADLKEFRHLRAAELKHGRVCMLAEFGLIVQATGVRLNFAYPYKSLPENSMQDAKSGIAAISEYGPQSAWFAVLVLLAGFVELGVWRQDDDRAPGAFDDPANYAEQWYGGADAEPQIARNFEDSELAHGRLAMVAFFGTVAAEYGSGYNALQQWQHAGDAWARTLDLFSGRLATGGYPWGQPL